ICRPQAAGTFAKLSYPDERRGMQASLATGPAVAGQCRFMRTRPNQCLNRSELGNLWRAHMLAGAEPSLSRDPRPRRGWVTQRVGVLVSRTGGLVMKVWSVIALLFAAAILATIPVSPQVTPRGLELRVDEAGAVTYGRYRRVNRRAYRRSYRYAQP